MIDMMLSDDCIGIVFSFLSIDDRASASTACTQWRMVALQHDNILASIVPLRDQLETLNEEEVFNYLKRLKRNLEQRYYSIQDGDYLTECQQRLSHVTLENMTVILKGAQNRGAKKRSDPWGCDGGATIYQDEDHILTMDLATTNEEINFLQLCFRKEVALYSARHGEQESKKYDYKPTLRILMNFQPRLQADDNTYVEPDWDIDLAFFEDVEYALSGMNIASVDEFAKFLNAMMQVAGISEVERFYIMHQFATDFTGGVLIDGISLQKPSNSDIEVPAIIYDESSDEEFTSYDDEEDCYDSEDYQE
jgi:uncharacterized protein (DUF1330 family)